MNMQHAKLMEAMTAYDRGATGRIQHFVKVYGLASTIGMLEGLDPEEQFVLETAAIVHDIGVSACHIICIGSNRFLIHFLEHLCFHKIIRI